MITPDVVMTTRYAIAFHDLQKEGYLNFGVLPDTCVSLEDAQSMLASRAEEVLDELVTVDAELDREPANYEIQFDDDNQSVAIVDLGGGLMGQRLIHTILTIQTIVV